MINTPTPAEFLAQREPDELEVDFSEPRPEPLESIAASLRQLVDMTQGHVEEEKASDRLREAFDDLDAKHGALYELLEEIETLLKPSTSKLANSVREAITRWRSPEAPVEEERTSAEPEPELVPEVDDAADQGAPAHDAPVEEWREYARGLGYAGADIDAANRSQIRTMLDIPHDR